MIEGGAPYVAVVCLCGSTRFKHEFRAAELQESLRGNIVLSLPVFSRSDLCLLEDGEVAVLEAVHRAKIAMAHEVLVIDVGGYIGPSSAAEVEYARRLGKRIRYWSQESEGSSGQRSGDLRPTELVAQCWRAQGIPLSDVPTLAVGEELKELSSSLLEEETAEFRAAIDAGDLVGLADALGDLLYVVHGVALVFGIPLDEVFQEIHRSNMTKVGPAGEVPRQANGKTAKGPWFEPPLLQPILDRHTVAAPPTA